MKNYTITKEQILQLHKMNKEGNDQLVSCDLENWFPEAFKVELTVGKWYRNGDDGCEKSIACVVEVNPKDKRMFSGYGFGILGEWYESKNLSSFGSSNWIPMTDEEVKQALKNEVIKRFGKDWETAEIDKCLVHGDTNPDFIICINTNHIWNKNGCIYNNGVFAEPLETKVITMERAVKILSKKYGQKVEIK